MDGVVIDSSPLWDYIIKTVVDKYSLNTELLKGNDGYNLSTEEAIKMILKYSNRYTLSLYSEIIEYVEHLYILNFQTKTSLIAGIIDVLEWLTDKNIKLVLVSNSSQTQVAAIVKHYQLDTYFQDIITSNDVKNGKPDKEPYIKALEKSGLQKNEALVIEDSLTGIDSAKNAGLDYIVVNNNRINGEDVIKNNMLLEYIKSLINIEVV